MGKLTFKPSIIESDFYSKLYDYSISYDLGDIYDSYQEIFNKEKNHTDAFNKLIKDIRDKYVQEYIETLINSEDETPEEAFGRESDINEVQANEYMSQSILDIEKSSLYNYLDSLEEPFRFNSFFTEVYYIPTIDRAMDVYDGIINPNQQELINIVCSQFRDKNKVLMIGENQVGLRLYLMGKKDINPSSYKNMLHYLIPKKKGNKTIYVLPKNWAKKAFDMLSFFLWDDYKRKFKSKKLLTDEIKSFYLSILEYVKQKTKVAVGYHFTPEYPKDGWNRWSEFRKVTKRKKR
jgi:hypothetical protein